MKLPVERFWRLIDSKKYSLPAVVLTLLMSCDSAFEPDLSGWKANVLPGRRKIELDLDGRKKTIELPGGPGIGYRYAQWTKSDDQILLTQVITTDTCQDYRIIAVDTTGAIVDTVYIAPPMTAVNFKLAPNDSLMVIKTYLDNCVESTDYKYIFYNRFSKKGLPDTVRVGNSRGILFGETVWSPDSRKVILSRWYSGEVKGFVYDLITKDTTNIDKGSNFIWSPVDKDVVAYINDHSIYLKNIQTGEAELVYAGKSKKGATLFRWDPSGEFLRMHVRSYLLNVEAPMFQRNVVIYLSIKDGRESETHLTGDEIHTWKKK